MTGNETFRPGSRFAPGYRVIEHLARSNVLDVYDAWSDERGSRVIIKTLRPDRDGDDRRRRALRREGRLLAQFTHPHIVRGYETLDEPLAIVMETLGGETLAHLVERRRRRRLSAAELGHLGLQLCSAAGYLHGSGLLHLDVKASNVVAEGGRAKLIDLSVARPPGRCEAGIGTWCYMAPEQARGGELGPPADVWGIGGLLFEAATGVRAFDDDADAELPQLVERAAPVGRRRRGLPRALAAAIDACLEPEPQRRPSIAALAAACEAAAGLPPSERRLGRARRVSAAGGHPTGGATLAA